MRGWGQQLRQAAVQANALLKSPGIRAAVVAHYRIFDMMAQEAIARLVGQAAANQAMFFDFSRNSSVSVILVLHTASIIPHPGSEKKGPGDDWHLNWPDEFRFRWHRKTVGGGGAVAGAG